MTKTRLARTVDKSDTASTTVPRNRTLPPALFAVSVAMPVTWLATVPIDKGVRAGAMMAQAVDPHHASAPDPALELEVETSMLNMR